MSSIEKCRGCAKADSCATYDQGHGSCSRFEPLLTIKSNPKRLKRTASQGKSLLSPELIKSWSDRRRRLRELLNSSDDKKIPA